MMLQLALLCAVILPPEAEKKTLRHEVREWLRSAPIWTGELFQELRFVNTKLLPKDFRWQWNPEKVPKPKIDPPEPPDIP